MAAINRAVAPTSTNQLSDWYAGTCLPLLTGFTPTTFSPQNFWNNTKLSSRDIENMEDLILEKMIATYQIDTTHIIYDATNFFTYIDTMQKCETAKRGHCKAKRNDLRVVGLSLMVTSDCNIPLLHETYPGNRPDAKEFRRMMEQLKVRYERISRKPADVTVVFDRGNNSEDNINYLKSGEFPLHYVGGLKKNQVKDLYQVSREHYVPLKGESLKNQSAYRTMMDVYGSNCTVLIVHNPELENGQLQGIALNQDKATKKLLELQESLMRRAIGEVKKGRAPTQESITAAVEKILKPEYMKGIFKYEILEKEDKLYLTFAPSEEALEQIRITHLGKTALFTDRHDFTN